MWLSFIVSLVARDRGNIPKNIGNNILITNNMYITKEYLSSVIHLIELSTDTPITLVEMISHQLRRDGNTAIVDFSIKNMRKFYNLDDGGMKSRIAHWESTLVNPYALKRDKSRAARCLYTIDQIKEGNIMVESRIFLTLRAKTGTELRNAECIAYRYLSSIGCVFRPVTWSMGDYLEYMAVLSNRFSKKIKSIPFVVNSPKTLSQLLPNSHSPGHDRGIYMGINTVNNTPYYKDFKNITMGRNIYVITNTGGGKTAIILNMCASALEDGYSVCVMDIKGNEFSNLCKAVGGATISLRESSEEYINSFKLIKEECTDLTAEKYFKERVNFSKLQMTILSGITDNDKKMMLDGFLDDFLQHLYTAIGVVQSNRNTWHNSLNLTPHLVWDYLEEYINEPIREKYSEILTYILSNLKMYFSIRGSKSYIFTREFQYKDLLVRPMIRFDFGILAGTTYDPVIFRLKFEYMSRINAEYVTSNFDRGLYTFKVLEESQAVNEDVLEAYAREYTLRRSQRQTTVLLGNSIDALVKSNAAAPIIETTTGLLIGKLSKPTVKLVLQNFDIGSKEGVIRYMSETSEYMRNFLFINNMEEHAISPILKVQYDVNKQYQILTPTKTSDKL